MSWRKCQCGSKIIDSTDVQPWQGIVIKEQDNWTIYEEISLAIAEYFKALERENLQD